MQSKNANMNLKNRYMSVLKKCAIINAFGSLALAAVLVVGATSANAANISNESVYDKAQKLSSHADNSYDQHQKSSSMISGKIISDASTENLTFLASREDSKTQYTTVVAEETAVIVNEDSITVIDEKIMYVDTKKYSAWIQPMYQNLYSSEFDVKGSSDDVSYTRNTFGINIGADITFSNNLTVGAAIQAGSADGAISGVVDTQAEFYGLSLYAAYTMDKLTVKADLGYVSTTNEMSVSNISVQDHYSANAITLGAVAEYRVELEQLDIIPYAGMRLTHLDHSSASFGDFSNFPSEEATVFSIPVGVRFEKEYMTESGVTVIPHANIGLEFAMGDLDEVEAVSVIGVRNESRFMNNIIDPVTFQIGFGLELVKNEYSFNLDYDFRLSNNTNEHALMANFRYKF